MASRFAFEEEKAIAALVYIASKAEEVPEFDKYKAAKLVFLADKYHLVRYGRPIFGDVYKALPYGPIPQRTMDILKEALAPESEPKTPAARRLAEALSVDRRFQNPRLTARTPRVNLEALSRSDIMAIDHVVALHGRKTFQDLLALTHGMAAYRNAWASRGSKKAKEMAYEDFFEEEPDAVQGALEEFLENQALASLTHGARRL